MSTPSVKRGTRVPLSPLLPLLSCGGVAGLCAQLATYPMDVVRGRLQTDGVAGPATGLGPMGFLRHIWRREGLAGLYKGMTLNFIKVGSGSRASLRATCIPVPLHGWAGSS